MAAVDPNKIDPESAAKANEILKGLKVDHVKTVSSPAASFYLWMTMVDVKDLREVKAFHNPPVLVKTVLQAVMLLLGESEQTAGDWGSIRRALNKTGNGAIIKRMAGVDSGKIDPKAATNATELLKDINVESANSVNKGITAFYIWATNVLGKV